VSSYNSIYHERTVPTSWSRSASCRPVLLVLDSLPAMKMYGGMELQLHSSYPQHEMEASFQLTNRPLYRREKNLRYWLCRPQSRLGSSSCL
jgi:hypothetical protein